jgi:hypothetical protein
MNSVNHTIRVHIIKVAPKACYFGIIIYYVLCRILRSTSKYRYRYAKIE